ncbi:50S ribosomal protein L25 [Candidatus Uhrbacteria bacterium]|nr:50S ribosomal protein L25 [Candidatus Uhrbacteria bacterium]
MNYTLSAQARTTKRAKDERIANRVPAVMYGHGIPSTSFSIGRSEFNKLLQLAGYSSLIDLSLGTNSPVKVLIKEVQVDPLSMAPAHVDFYQVRMDEELTAHVPLKFTGESRAVKEDGGTLVKSLDTIEVRCLPGNLPHEIEISLTTLATFDDAVTVAHLALPAGVVAVTDGTLTIATVARPFTEEELKKMESSEAADVTTIKTEGEEKKAAGEAKKAEETAAEEAAKK